MIAAVADTHTVIWYLAADTRLSHAARRTIDTAARNGNRIAISAITLVEMVYLIERGRIPAQRFTELIDELSDIGSVFVETPLDVLTARTLTRIDAAQVPDMPDRIIAATAVQLNVPLISRDARIQASSVRTIW
jgi:PIN domain nuclease of toxin-antitoxin system